MAAHSRNVFPALCVACRPVWVSLILARWYAIPCGLCVQWPRSGCPSDFPRVSFVCVCARALAASAPPPLPGLVWRAHLARSRCWALVGPFHVVRAPPRVLPGSRAPFGLPWGGGCPFLFPPTPLGAARSPWGGCGRGDPSPTPPRALLRTGLARWLGALYGRHKGARGGRLRPGCWGVRGRALSHPRPLVLSGVRPGPTTHWLWMRGVRAWGPITNPTARALASSLCALWGRHEGARGGASCLGVGRPGSGALPAPTTRPLGRAAGAHYQLAVGAGGAGVGTRQKSHSAPSCELVLRAVGAACGCLAGAPLALVWGARVGRSPAPGHSSFPACGQGPLPTGCGCGGCGRGDPSPTQLRALLRAGFVRCQGGTRAPGGGAPCLGVGRPGSGALPPPTTRPFGRAAGAHYPLL